MAEEKKMMKIPHNVILEDRRVLTVSGVTDIDSFDALYGFGRTDY